MFPSYFVINVFAEFISIRVISIFNSLFLFDSLSLFLSQTLHASHSRLSFPTTRERSRRLWCRLPCRLENREKYRYIHSITRNLCSRARAYETVRDKFLADWQVTERHGRSISPSRHWSRSRRALYLPNGSVHSEKETRSTLIVI